MIAIVVTYRFVDNKPITREITSPELVKILDKYYTNNPEDIKSKEEILKPKPKKVWPKKKQEKIAKPITPILFKFDPNIIDYDGLIKSGFTSKQAFTLIKFRNSGFIFKIKSDLKRVHGLDSALIKRLENYIDLPIELAKKQPIKKKQKDTIITTTEKIDIPIKKIEINHATYDDLVALYGIGDFYASRILKYRDRLGGYIDLAQIKEAHEFPDSTFSILDKHLITDKTKLKKLNINMVSFKELLAHPYINYEQTKILYPYISTRRPIDNLNVLDKILAIDTSIVNRLKPYLTTQ